MAPDDLSWASDEELYALEQQRSIEPARLAEIDDELRRRRRSRREALADVTRPAPAMPTLGDIERIAGSLEATMAARVARLERRVQRLRWWVLAAPLLWGAAGVAAWMALQQWAPSVLRGLAVP
jgi:hypothetical protein